VRPSGSSRRETWLQEVLASGPRKFPVSTRFCSAFHHESKLEYPAWASEFCHSGLVYELSDIVKMEGS